jgi:hypothetical protein
VSWRPVRRLRLSICRGLTDEGPRALDPIEFTQAGVAEFYASKITNMLADAGRLTTRNAHHRPSTPYPSSSPAFDTCKLLAVLDQSSDGQQLVGLFASSVDLDDGAIYKLDGLEGAVGDWDVLVGSGTAKLSAVSQWDWTQYSRRLYLSSGNVRRTDSTADDNLPKVYDGEKIYDLFIPAPSAAPPAYVVNNGVLSGTYKYCYTYVRTRDGAESPPSEIATVSPSSQNVSVTVRTMLSPLTSDRQATEVDRINIYRTTDGGATFRLLRVINNDPTAATTVTFTDSESDADLSSTELTTLSALNDLAGVVVEAHDDRLYFGHTLEATDISRRGSSTVHAAIEKFPNRIRWSEPGEPWHMQALSFDNRIPSSVRAMKSSEAGLLIFTAKTLWILRNRGGIVDMLDTGLPGADGPMAVTRYRGGVMWINSEGAHFMDRYTRYRTISDPGITRRVEQLVAERMDEAIMMAQPRSRKIVTIVPERNARPDTVMVYDRLRQEWYRVTGQTSEDDQTDRFQFEQGVDVHREDGRDWMLASSDGNAQIYRLLERDTYTFSEIEIEATDFGFPVFKRFRRVEVKFKADDDVTVTGTFRLDRDSAQSSETRTITVSGGIALDGTVDLDGTSTLSDHGELTANFDIDDDAISLGATFQFDNGLSGAAENNGGRVWDVTIDIYVQLLRPEVAC